MCGVDRLAPVADRVSAELILDLVGAAYLSENIAAVAPRGTIVIIGLVGGISGTAPLGAILRKRVTMIGTVLRSRSLEEKAQLSRDFARDVVPMFDDGKLKPVVDQVMPMDEVRIAHTLMERNETFGKLVLSWG